METQDTTNTATQAQRVTSAGLIIPAIGLAWPGQGGIYIGELPAAGGRPGVHMVVSAEEAEGLEWGGYGTRVPGADSRHDGRANTRALLEHQQQGEHTHPAATWCAQHVADGHQDFHLPSQLELQIASALCPQAFNQDDYHWASTQGSASDAFVQVFEYGYSYWSFKDDMFRVRAVRWIPL